MSDVSVVDEQCAADKAHSASRSHIGDAEVVSAGPARAGKLSVEQSEVIAKLAQDTLDPGVWLFSGGRRARSYAPARPSP
jgi:hypothetical protein